MESFEELRPRLFAIAYNMLGSVMEAEDIVQDAYVRYQLVDQEKVQHPQAFLRKMVTRLCLDTLKSARVQREEYIGPWLPEPILTDANSIGQNPEVHLSRTETISLAFLALMEQLSPLERAVFLLREVFDYDYAEIASTLERSEAACRKLFSRAKQHLTENRPTLEESPQSVAPMVAGFLQAAQTGDMEALLKFLAEDVQLTSDGGGKVAAATRPLHGREIVARFFLGITRQMQKAGVDIGTSVREFNGSPGVIVRDKDTQQIFAVFVFQLEQGKLQSIQAIRNPDKLRHLRV